MDDNNIFDITIIGGGPIGLFGLYYAGLRSARAKIIDSLPELGGQLSALYPEKYIFDVPGFPKVIAKDYVALLKEQALQFEPTVCLDRKVEKLEMTESGIIRLATQQDEHWSKSVIVCAGVGAFMPRTLDIQRLDELQNKGVYYFVKDKSIFRDQKVLVIGGGDTAVDWACELTSIARDITLINKFHVWQAHEASVRKMMSGSTKIRMFWELQAVHGENHVEAATIRNNKTGETETLQVESILVNIGFISNLGPITSWGIELEGNGVKVGPQMQTNIPGVYAAGDIASYEGKVKLIATGHGEVATAVNHAKHYIDPKSRVFPGHSTDRKDLEKTLTTNDQQDGEAIASS